MSAHYLDDLDEQLFQGLHIMDCLALFYSLSLLFQLLFEGFGLFLILFYQLLYLLFVEVFYFYQTVLLLLSFQ